MSMTLKNKIVAGVASAAVTGLLVVGGAALADAASTPTSSSSASSSESARGGSHTAVTGDEATRVSAAVTAQDSAVTVTGVQKDANGSYDVEATKAGADVDFDVSADLATVTARAEGGGRGGHGGGSADTPVTGDAATAASAAVTAQDSAVTVVSVRQDPDGSYDVLGTKAGADVMFDVSADLSTVTQSTGGGHGHQDGAAGSDASASA